MCSSLLKKAAFFCAAAFLALCTGGLAPAWAGSALEGAGLVDTTMFIQDDAGGLVGNTVTLVAPGSIISTSTASIYNITSGYTLKTGANTLTVSGYPSGMTGITNIGGAFEIDSGGTVALQTRNTTINNYSGTVTNNGTVLASNGTIRNDDNAVFNNNGLITLAGTGSINHGASTGGERLVNTGGTIIFNDPTTTHYFASGHAGTINNAGGYIRIAFDHGNRDALLSDLNTADAGTIEFTSGNVGSAGFTNTDFARGWFEFSAAQTTSAVINVGNANVSFTNGGTFGADVTARTIRLGGASTYAFATGVRANGNLEIQSDTSYDAAFSGYYIMVQNNATLALGSNADVTISNGNVLSLSGASDKVTLASGAQLTFALGSAFSGNGTVTADGTVKADAGMVSSVALFGKTNLGATGEFRLNASRNGTQTADFVSGTNASGSRVVLSANAPGLRVTMGGVVDAGGADLTIESGVYRFTKTGGPTILAADTFSLGAGATLEYVTGANDVGRVHSATGPASIAGNLVVGAGDTLAFSGTARFANGSSITLNPGATVTAATFDFSALSANGLALALKGDKTDWLNQLLFDDVTDAGVFYTGRYRTAVSGTQLAITDYITSVSEVLGGLVANDMSVNLDNGFALLDGIDADASVGQSLKDALNNDTAVIEGWLSSPASYGRGLRAQRQRQGEYGNAAREALSTTTALFGRGLARRFDANVDLHFGLNSFASASARGGDGAYASLSGKQVRSRNGGYDYCPAATTVWADFHGGWAEQKAKSNINGYEYDGYGVSVGAERRIDRFLVGVAGGYTRAGVDVDDLSTDYDADVMNLGVYAGYIHESGFFARAGLGFAQAWNDYDVAMAMGPNKKGDFDSQAYTADLDLGYVIRACAVNVVPSVGLRYTHIRQDGWRESGGRQGTAGFFEKEHYNAVDVPVALRVNRVFETGTVKIAPEARAAWVYAAKRNRSEINYGLQGANSIATMYGVNPGRSRFQVGAGVKAQWGGRYEAGLDYDYEFRSKYHNHNLSVNLGVSF